MTNSAIPAKDLLTLPPNSLPPPFGTRLVRAVLTGLGAASLVCSSGVSLEKDTAEVPARPQPVLEQLFVSRVLTEPGGFTSGIEGPAVGPDGALYAVNYARQHTIGRVAPDGTCSVFVDLPGGSTGNGIRFSRDGVMFIADYTKHNVLRVDMRTRAVTVFVHEPKMSQPNDIAIAADDTLYASDPDWKEASGRLWRVRRNGHIDLLEEGMGTTNGIEVSADERKLYVNESRQRNVWEYSLSPSGEIGEKRLLIRFADGGLDGMRCDIQGNLYVTRYDKGLVAVVSPQGEVLRRVALTGNKPSNLAFGGDDGRTCYVTLADRGNVEVFRTELPGRSWQLARERMGRSGE